jgi:ATP-dependent Clp protease ATP-binding subunit ClpA
MIRLRLKLVLLAAIGDDGTGLLWHRLTPDGRRMLKLAIVEARALRHPCIAEEHLVLGLLRHGAGPAAGLLHEHGLDLATTRAGLLAVGPTLPARSDPADALRGLGVDVARIRQRLEATFGADAVRAAERRARRRPWWRGGHPRPRPLCVYLLARRAFRFAVEHADRRGDARIGPPHLLLGALRAAQDPLGAHLSRRSARALASTGWTPGRANPLRLMLETRGLDLTRLTTQVAGMTA